MLDVWALAKLARPLSVRQLFSRIAGGTNRLYTLVAVPLVQLPCNDFLTHRRLLDTISKEQTLTLIGPNRPPHEWEAFKDSPVRLARYGSFVSP